MGQGLKNTRKSRADMDERREAVEEFARVKLSTMRFCPFDPTFASKNLENMIGCVHVPLGFAGPIRVNGEHASGDFIVPLATTEGALIATVNRGCGVITASGGANPTIVKDEMTRAPVFRVRNVKHGVEVAAWVEAHLDELRVLASTTTGHGKLLSASTSASGRSLYVRFAFDTGDAMGMNMVTIAADRLARRIEEATGAKMISVSGNFCVDKKPSAINFILGRGKTVLADATIPRGIVESKLKLTPEELAEAAYRKNLMGSAMSLAYGFNAHVANVLAAVFIATGQDPAQVVEGSMGFTTAEVVEGDLYISLRLPSLEVGTVGGGTKLPSQNEALSMIGCVGAGKARKFAEIIASVALAGELSTLAAQAKGELASAHQTLGR
ncbi:MAG TPA: hydroxymethylglutaryl-CoA reductase (NADPH) [Methanomassiliicoccales archaeon]|nr:hydroxymethylglutaryl-CoA reductase (NADPH) [Methanomassiliicoccales archaeon]